jgi:hypothetical protein
VKKLRIVKRAPKIDVKWPILGKYEGRSLGDSMPNAIRLEIADEVVDNFSIIAEKLGREIELTKNEFYNHSLSCDGVGITSESYGLDFGRGWWDALYFVFSKQGYKVLEVPENPIEWFYTILKK